MSHSSNILTNRDINTSVPSNPFNTKADSMEGEGADKSKNMEYHRQVLQSKLDEDKKQPYVSPSDTIMSPCTAKLSALKNKRFGKAKPHTLFAKTSAKNLSSSTSITTTAEASGGQHSEAAEAQRGGAS